MTIPTDSELAQAYSQGYQDGRKGLEEVVAALHSLVAACTTMPLNAYERAHPMGVQMPDKATVQQARAALAKLE